MNECEEKEKIENEPPSHFLGAAELRSAQPRFAHYVDFYVAEERILWQFNEFFQTSHRKS